MQALSQDLRYAARTLVRSPGFTAVTVLTLALGIGATTAMFGMVNAVLLQPLPYPDADRLVLVWETAPDGVQNNVVSSGNYLDWRERASAFEEIGTVQVAVGMTLTGAGEPARVGVSDVTPSALDALGVPAELGRRFTAAEGRPGGADVLLISHELWQGRFSGDPDVVGRTLDLNDEPHIVVGVMPPEFDFPTRSTEMWLPQRFGEADRLERRSHNYAVIARLRPGITAERAETEMNTLAAAIAEDHPRYMTGWGVNVVPLRDELAASVRPMLLMLFAAVGAVLLIACTNLMNLLLARATGREQEIAVRGVLGAGRLRLVRQLVTETGLLTFLSAALGLFMVAVGLDTLIVLAPEAIPLLDRAEVDLAVFLFAAGVSLLVALLLGLVPGLRLTRSGRAASLAADGARGGGPRHSRLRSVLLSTEIALSIVVLIVAALLLRSFEALRAVDYGFAPDGVLAVALDLPEARYATQDEQVSFYARLVERVRSLPGVAAAAGTSDPPAGGYNMTFGFAIVGRPAGTPSGLEDDEPLRAVTPSYFRTMGIPLIRGRGFLGSDAGDSPRVVVINEALARKHWPDGDPVDERICIEGPGQEPCFQIVGVVGDTRHYGLDSPVRPALYIAHAQKPWGWLSWLILTVRAEDGIAPESLAPGVRAAITELDPALPPERVTTVADMYAESTARRRFAMWLMVGFAATAISLCTLGIYGVLSWSIARRRREIGVRMALGADARNVRRLVLRQVAAMTAAGLAAGLGMAFVATRALTSQLYGVSATDAVSFISVPLLVVVVALLGCYVPARRATEVNPVTALRDE